MIPFWFIGDKGSFDETRKGRIGASDIPAILPNPEKPTESLAGYGRTAVSTYLEKRGERKRDMPGLPAEIGHYLENKSLELFIRMFDDADVGADFRIEKESYESIVEAQSARPHQVDPYFHSTEYLNDDFIAHPDMLYVPGNEDWDEPGSWKKTINGIAVDFSSPFLVEAKSAQLFAAKRREGSLVSGYDFDLLSHQGIPLKHFVQIQFQLALFEVKTAYLALIYDTSNFQVWRVDAHKEWQGRIIDISGKMAKCIREGRMPRELAMNRADIMEIHPKHEKDYVMLTGGELEIVEETCREYRHAEDQEKKWKAKKEDANDAMAVHLAEYEELRGPNGKALAVWRENKGREGIKKPEDVEGKDSFLNFIKKNDSNCYRYLLKRGYIRKGADSRSVSIKWKGE